MEVSDQEGALPFLDTLVSPHPNNTLITTLYRKPTHTNQYLHWDSNHFIPGKNSVFNTLAHRAKVVSTNQQELQNEMEHIRKTLQACSFPPWALNMPHNKFNCKHNIHNRQTSTDNQPSYNNNNCGTNNNSNNKNISILVPDIHGLGERFKRTCNHMVIEVDFKGTNTLKTLLMAPKDRDSKLQKSWSFVNLNVHISTAQKNT